MEFTEHHAEILANCEIFYTTLIQSERSKAAQFLSSVSVEDIYCLLSKLSQSVSTPKVLDCREKPEYWAFVFGFGFFYNFVTAKYDFFAYTRILTHNIISLCLHIVSTILKV